MNSEPAADIPIGVPPPRIHRRRWIPSLVWVVPLMAAAIGASLVVSAWRSAGPSITVSFQTAQGLDIGKTLVKYRNVTIGRVTGIALSADRNRVLVSADLVRSAKDLLSADARFWVVRPRVGIGWVSGLETLISGSYIAMESGNSKARHTEFVGLENPPPLTHGQFGKSFVLSTRDIGSLALDAPVYFHHFEVGHVIDRHLEPTGQGARAVVFIDAPYDRLVTRGTRFWNASGVDLTLRADGLKLHTQSLASVLAGGVAFETLPTAQNVEEVPAGSDFELFSDQAAAMAPPDGEPRTVRMRFAQSLRGLSRGAPVDFVGVNIGEVYSIDLDYDPVRESFPVVVTALVYPRRMGRAYEVLEEKGATSVDSMARLVQHLVARGLRAQPHIGNVLTGQLYIALDFVPSARPARFDVNARPLEIPTVSSSVQQLQQRLVSIVDKLDNVPLDEIGAHLDADLVDLDGALRQLRTDVLPTGTGALDSLQRTLNVVDRSLASDAPWRANVDETLAEAGRTLRSLRSLTDYIDRHPEALLRGRQSSQPESAERAASAAQGTK